LIIFNDDIASCTRRVNLLVVFLLWGDELNYL